MSDLERKTVEESVPLSISDDELKTIILSVITKLDSFKRGMTEHKARKLTRKTVKVLRDHAVPGMHVQDSNKSVAPAFWTKRKKLEWMAGQLLEVTDMTDLPIGMVMNVALTHIKSQIEWIDKT